MSKIRHYATLCTVDFLPQVIALHASLELHSSNRVMLHVLPLDSECAELLPSIAKPSIRPVHGFHQWHEGMSEARTNRTLQEYAWTCGSNLCEYLMIQGFDEITYLDADIFCFADPAIIFKEIGERSIGIIPHRLADADLPRLGQNGHFNVSWVTARGDVGRKCIELWARQCREWCYYRNEPGRFGDQAYLDAWPMLYGSDLCVISNIGAGAAPWNLQQYDVTLREGRIFLNNTPLIFMHYHEFRWNDDGSIRFTNWPLRLIDKELIYAPYVEALRRARELLPRPISK